MNVIKVTAFLFLSGWTEAPCRLSTVVLVAVIKLAVILCEAEVP